MDIINITSNRQTALPTDSTTLEAGLSELIINWSLNAQFSAKLTELKLYINVSQSWFALIPGHSICSGLKS